MAKGYFSAGSFVPFTLILSEDEKAKSTKRPKKQTENKKKGRVEKKIIVTKKK